MPVERDVGRAARLLAAGELVAMPTETVYGLAADAANVAAIAKIFALKQRPADHPLIVHVAEVAQVSEWTGPLPPAARLLAERFWPGPLTLILPRADRVPLAVTGGQASVGIRCPSHPTAQALLREFARVGSGAVAAPSANRFGHVSPTSAAHVRDEFGDGLFILDGGDCEVGLESTIVDLSREDAVLLRPGGVARAAIELALGIRLRDRDADAPRAPGTLAAHYAPRTPLRLVDLDQLDAERDALGDAAVLALAPRPDGFAVHAWRDGTHDAARYAHDLYGNLRALDASGAARILVELPPRGPAWEAVHDRLARAAGGAPLDDEP